MAVKLKKKQVKKFNKFLLQNIDISGMPYVIARTYSAGVFAGYLESRVGQEVVLLKARRLWYWEGAASLSQLSMEGVKEPEKCKFPCEVLRVELLETIEILDTTPIAQKSIQDVEVWAAPEPDGK